MKVLKKTTIYFLVLATIILSNIAIAKAETLRPVVLTKSAGLKNGEYVVNLSWNNPNLNYGSMDPDGGGFMIYQIYQDNIQVKTIQDTRQTSYQYTQKLSQIEATSRSHSYHIIVYVTKTINGGTAYSQKSNVQTVQPSDFGGEAQDPTPPGTNTITPPRVVGSLSDKKITLKWDRTTYTGCDDGATISYKIYRDGTRIATDSSNVIVYSYSQTLSAADAAQSHSYYVTTHCSRVAGGTQALESLPSNIIKYNPPQGTNPATLGAQDDITYTESDITPAQTDKDNDECVKTCPGNWIRHAICESQCAVLSWMKEIIIWLTNSILMPALGLGESTDSVTLPSQSAPGSTSGSGGTGGSGGDGSGGGGGGGGF